MLLVTTTYPPATAGDFFGYTSMEPKTDDHQLEIEPTCNEELKAKKQMLDKRQKKVLSELGKTLSELKNGVYQIERLPED